MRDALIVAAFVIYTASAFSLMAAALAASVKLRALLNQPNPRRRKSLLHSPLKGLRHRPGQSSPTVDISAQNALTNKGMTNED